MHNQDHTAASNNRQYVEKSIPTQPSTPYVGYRNEQQEGSPPTELQEAVASLSTAVASALGDIRTLKVRIAPILQPELPCSNIKQQEASGSPHCELTSRLRLIAIHAESISGEVRDTLARLAV